MDRTEEKYTKKEEKTKKGTKKKAIKTKIKNKKTKNLCLRLETYIINRDVYII